MPQFRAGGFTPASEDGFSPGVKNGDRRLGENYRALGITEISDANQGVLEGRENVAVGRSRGDPWEYKIARCGRFMGVSGGIADANCWRSWVDVGARCTLG